MSGKSQDEKSFLNMAGEFLVAAELNRRGILCAVTYGAAKCADVWAFSKTGNRSVRIEVKTTGPGSERWVVGNRILQQEGSPDVFWVLVKLPSPHPSEATTDEQRRGRHAPRFFVFTSAEMKQIMTEDAMRYKERYLRVHGHEFTGRGVPTLSLAKVQDFENRWDKIKDRAQGSVSASPVQPN